MQSEPSLPQNNDSSSNRKLLQEDQHNQNIGRPDSCGKRLVRFPQLLLLRRREQLVTQQTKKNQYTGLTRESRYRLLGELQRITV